VLCIGPHGRTQTNVFLVRSRDVAVLVDTGWAGDAFRILEAVRAALGPGLSPSAIVLTHVHPDHAGAAGALAIEWGCPVYAQRAEVPIAEGDLGEMSRVAGPLDRWLILPVLRAVGERRRAEIVARSGLAGVVQPLPDDGCVPGLDGWAWLAMPGHTPGRIALLRTADRVVLTGDALLTLKVNTLAGALGGRQGLSGPPWYTTWDAEAARASFRAIADLEPAVMGPGHGHPLSGPGTAARLQAIAASTRTR
jgi:glyoxylase-like metal-dependent hydrolase (beta-lactamase superfamily II)